MYKEEFIKVKEALIREKKGKEYADEKLAEELSQSVFQDVQHDLEKKTREAETLIDFVNDILTNNERLNEEMRAKAQQVRQYKKLADSRLEERQREEDVTVSYYMYQYLIVISV